MARSGICQRLILCRTPPTPRRRRRSSVLGLFFARTPLGQPLHHELKLLFFSSLGRGPPSGPSPSAQRPSPTITACLHSGLRRSPLRLRGFARCPEAARPNHPNPESRNPQQNLALGGAAAAVVGGGTERKWGDQARTEGRGPRRRARARGAATLGDAAPASRAPGGRRRAAPRRAGRQATLLPGSQAPPAGRVRCSAACLPAVVQPCCGRSCCRLLQCQNSVSGLVEWFCGLWLWSVISGCEL